MEVKTCTYTVSGQDITGDHSVRAGKASIRFIGKTTHKIYAYFNGEEACQQLVGQPHMDANQAYVVLQTANEGDYILSAGESLKSDPSNGKLHVGS
jgi:hypothetical protein